MFNYIHIQVNKLTTLGANQPSIQWVLVGSFFWGGGNSQGMKLITDHSPPASANIKKTWACMSTPPHILMMCLISLAKGQLYLYSLTLPL
jgi:hypothetical protein